MAIWQFDLHCIPRLAILNLSKIEIINFDFDEFNWLKLAESNRKDLQGDLIDSLPIIEKWGIYHEIHGQIDGNRVDLSYDVNDKINSIFIRIDLSNNSDIFTLKVQEFLLLNNFLIVLRKKFLIDPKIESIIDIIKYRKYRKITDLQLFETHNQV